MDDDHISLLFLKKCLPRKYHPMETDSDALTSVADYIQTLKTSNSRMANHLNDPLLCNGDNIELDELSVLNNMTIDETSNVYFTDEEEMDIDFIGNYCSLLLKQEREDAVAEPAPIMPNLTLTDMDFVLQITPTDPGVNETPKRPGNAYIRFSCEMRPHVVARHPKQDNRFISKIIGQLWHQVKAEEKKKYTDEFYREMAQLRDTHPTWNYAGSRAKADAAVSASDESLVLESRLRDRSIDRSVKTLMSEMPPQIKSKAKKKTSSKRKQSDCKKSEDRNSVANTTNWVECDLCGLWRELKPQEDVHNLPETWYCYMNSDEQHNTCFEC